MRKLLIQLWLVIGSIAAGPATAENIAIIIDDMANAKRDAKAFSLPVEVAFSILPHTSHSTAFSQRAAAQQRDVILHIPMESLAG